ncbi:acyl transferase domain-containing protein [Mycena crocata]|nr:acyl transferase domain-containing protein [Mycena crocata]
MASSGIGGSNGHVVLEGPPQLPSVNQTFCSINGPVLVMASGLSPRSASATAEQLSQIFATLPTSEYAATRTVLGRRAKQMNWRSYAVTTPGSSIQFCSPQYSSRDTNSLVFVFSGQGPQHEHMGRELFNTSSVFRDSILEMDVVFQKKTNKSIVQDYGLFASTSSSYEFPIVWPISLTLPSIAMFQMALFDLLIYLGVRPDIVLGHSAGETALLYASGAASKAMAVELAIIRGQIFSTLETSGGTMAALSCSVEKAEKLLAQQRSAVGEGVVEVACLNSPSAVAISGCERSIDGALELAQQAGIFGRKIRTRVPIHSAMMIACEKAYRAEVEDLFDRYPGDHVPMIPTYSTLTGKPFPGPFTADYFWENTRSQVLFEPVVRKLSVGSTFVEIAPHPVLSSYLSDMSADSSVVLSIARRAKTGSTEYHDMLQFLGKLTVAGHNGVNFTLLNSAAASESKVTLPAYPFLKKQFPLFPQTRTSDHHYGPMNHSRLKLNRDTHPTLSEHVIRGEPIWPAAGFLEMGLEFGATSLFNVNFHAMLPLSAESPVPVNITLDGSYWKVTSSVPEARGQHSGDHIERVHADGYLSYEAPPAYDDLNISDIRTRCHSHVDSEIYPSLSYFSAYGPKFQRATNLYYNVNEALASIRGMDGSLTTENAYILHPAILDACFHIAAYRPFNGDFAPNNYYLPSRIGELILHQKSKAEYFPPHVYAHIQFSCWLPESMRFEVTVVDDLGKRLCTLRNFEMARHQISPSREISSPLHVAIQPVFHGARNSDPLAGVNDPEKAELYSGNDQNVRPHSRQLIFLLKRILVACSPAESQYDAFVFNYKFGDEEQLQWDFSGLNPSQELDIWILSTEGLDTAAGLGLVRALRREYLFWNIRFVSFPEFFSEEMQMDSLSTLPSYMREEPDILFSQTGDPLVPRIAPLLTSGRIKPQPQLPSGTPDLDPDHAVVVIHRTSRFPDFSVFVGSVVQVNPEAAEYHPGSLVIGLQQQASKVRTTIDLGSTCVIPSDISFDVLVEHVPGVVVSMLAHGLDAYVRPHRIQALSVLITHCDTVIGSSVCDVYARDGLKFSRVDQDVSMLDLARTGNQSFDLIISGYEDNIHTQVLRGLLRPSKGKLFLWHHELPKILRHDPCSIGAVLRSAISMGYMKATQKREGPQQSIAVDAHNVDSLGDDTPGAVFDPEKTYVVLGGIGSLGASIAVFMVQRGARHIVLTSRSGKASFHARKANSLIVQRIITYLQSLEFLELRLVAVDATCPKSMNMLFHSIEREIGGCFILTAVLADGLFPTLGEKEFKAVYASKTGVLATLQQTTDTAAMEFVIAFSSVTTLVGTGGQVNYCIANAALEERILRLPNGICFVCPAIIDTAMMDADSDGSRLKHLTEWSISTDEMLLWLNDALGKFQQGARFQKYIPNLDWDAEHRTHGMARLGAHLLQNLTRDGTAETQVETEPILVKASRIIRNLLNVSEDDFSVDVPLTSYGVDSLSAARLSFTLRPILEVTQLQLLADNSLADLVNKFSEFPQNSTILQGSKISGPRSTGDSALMDELVHKFMTTISHLPKRTVLDHDAPHAHTVLLTGSTGALGCHLLAHLLARDDIQHVYALNRSIAGGDILIDRQAAALKIQGLAPALAHSEKLTLIVGDLCADEFGIPSERFHELHTSVTHIIHNAWRVDFMAPLSEFEPLLFGTTQLLEFAITSLRPVPPSFSFISTIGVYQNLSSKILSAPEAPIADAAVAIRTGYVESKWVGERLVQMTSETRYLNANVIRVGLLTGSDTGAWDVSQWVPAIVESGIHIGCLPDGNGIISWIPTSIAAAAIVDMQGSMNETLHLVHPKPTTWKAIMDPVASMLNVPLVPYAEWFARLKSTADFAHRQGESPGATALKLLDYFQFGLKPALNAESMGLLPTVVSHKGIHASKTLMDDRVLPFDSTDIEKCVRYWRGVGFLP